MIFEVDSSRSVVSKHIGYELEEGGHKSEKVNPNPALSEKIAVHFGAHEDCDLAGVEPPGLFFGPLLGARDYVLRAHTGPPSEPMRY
jgi:hypothetical protein